MRSVEEAITSILAAVRRLPSEEVPLLEAAGRVLTTDVDSREALPPFDNSSMDGYAVRAVDIASATSQQPVTLHVVMDIPAGVTPAETVGAGQAARIMTGAPLPVGADAVVPVEDTNAVWTSENSTDLTHIRISRAVTAGGYIRRRGENIETGARVLDAGTVLGAPQIGMLAALGYTHVPVFRRPRVAIVTSGDEIVRFDQTPAPGQIRDANSPSLYVRVLQNGGLPFIVKAARDTAEDVRRMFAEALALQPDLIISTAGVSVGAADFTRQILVEMGTLDFWKINLRPGKPLAFGSLEDVMFFGLPGNPVSALVTFEVLVLPALRFMAGLPHEPLTISAQAAQPIASDGRQSYLRVRLERQQDSWLATETGTQSSGALMSLVVADGLLIVPAGVTQVEQGQLCRVQLLR